MNILSYVHRRPTPVASAILTLFMLLAASEVTAQVRIRGDRRTSEPEPPNINSVIIVKCELPKTYIPASSPTLPVDDTIRVGIVLPVFDATSENNATWFQKAPGPIYFRSEEERLRLIRNPPVNRIILNFADPMSAVLPRIMARLFSRAEILRAPASQYDLILRFDLSPRTTSSNDTTLSIEVTGTIAAESADGRLISRIAAVGTAEANRGVYWSERTQGRVIGVPALQSMLDQLVRNVLADKSFTDYVRETTARKARPSELETTARFDDTQGILPNGQLDGGENARVIVKVRNRGPGPAFGVRVQTPSNIRGVSFSSGTNVGDLSPDTEKEVTVAIASTLDLQTGTLKIPIETAEQRGYHGRAVVLEVPTGGLKRPSLEIADISLNDLSRQPGAESRPTNGSTLEAVVLVRNNGQGDAANVMVSVASDVRGVELIVPNVIVPMIPVNSVREARLRIHLPVIFDVQSVTLTFGAMEGRGPDVAHTSRSKAWQVQLRRPAVDIAYRMFDGNSARSTGDRDGVANNGEELEVVLTPANHGDLPARNVRISLSSRHEGVILSEKLFDVGDLPPNASAGEHRPRLLISRALARDAAVDKLTLVATISQRDFPQQEQVIVLPFRAYRPELVADVASTAPLVEGTSTTLWLQVKNQGLLPATDVYVELSCDDQGIDLLDDLGAPARKLRLNIGTVGARASAPRVQVKAHVRRNHALAAGAVLTVIASQRDFPAVRRQADLKIEKEEAAIIPTGTPVAEIPTAVRRQLSPASISFRRYEHGDHVDDESINLRFTVQSQSALETVRIEQNGRVLDLSPAQRPEANLSLFEQQVYLAYGQNDFEVVAVTTEGVRSNALLSINRNRPEGKVWVAVIGISKYADPNIDDLNFAKSDATAVFEYYRERLRLPEEQMLKLLDETATRANIKRTLGTELVKKAINPNDTVILYFAGHGQAESDHGSLDPDGLNKYLLPYDAALADLFTSALSMDELGDILRRFRPERVVLIIDSCFSGAAGSGGRSPADADDRPRSIITDDFLSRIASAGKGRVILTASMARESARERPSLGHGIFTSFLLKGLNGDADSNRDGRIDVDEIYSFVSHNVVRATDGAQNPVKKAPDQAGMVIVGRTAGFVPH